MAFVVTSNLIHGFIILFVFAVVIRILTVFVNIWYSKHTFIRKRKDGICRVKTMAVLGSGGHTTEMFKLLEQLDQRVYSPLVFVVANTDKLSLEKINKFEDEHSKKSEEMTSEKYYELRGKNVYQLSLPSPKKVEIDNSIIEIIPRSREVGQSYFTSIFTTLIASIHAFKIVYAHKPDVILVNGPGSCVPICLCSVLFRLLWVMNCRITFVESYCRVKSLSLTGKILQWFADDFIVQWPELKEKYPGSVYRGRFV